MAHQHQWEELRRQIPYTARDFDKDVLAPERARYSMDHPDEEKRGQPHTDEDHYDKVAVPKPEIVFYCPSCTSTQAYTIPAERYKEIVAALESGELTDEDLSLLPLDQLVPEIAGKLSPLALSKTGASATRRDGEVLVKSGLSGEAAEALDARLRKQYGLSPIERADDTPVESAEGVE